MLPQSRLYNFENLCTHIYFVVMTVVMSRFSSMKLKSFSPVLARTVNLYPKRTPDLLTRSDIKTLGWEERPVRVANAITWLLKHAKEEGLTPRKDGCVCVEELVNITFIPFSY